MISRRRFSFAALAACAVVAGCAGAGFPTLGYNIQPQDKQRIQLGMSSAQVLQLLGPPRLNRRFNNLPGPSWTWRIHSSENLVFDVDFDADGKVIAMVERVEDNLFRGRLD